MSHGSKTRPRSSPGPAARSLQAATAFLGRLPLRRLLLGRIPPQAALIVAGPILAGLILAAPVLAIASLITTLAASAMPAVASTPAAARVPSSLVCAGYSGCARHGHPSYGYGRRRHHSFWRMSPGNECTNYVAYVESRHFGVRTPRYLLGNAYQWPRRAGAHGVRVNRRPSAGAVAEWGPHAYGIGRNGHVAVVQKVGPHDRYIIVSQQHLLAVANGYDWTRINAGWPRKSWQSWPTHFIHFRIRRHR
jgi:surface antigen